MAGDPQGAREKVAHDAERPTGEGFVDFEIARCANPSACKQQPLIVSDPATGVGTALTGSCGGPYQTVKKFRVRRDDLLRALGVTPPDLGRAPATGATGDPQRASGAQEPRLLSDDELRLVRDTAGAVIGEKDSDGRVIWIADIIHTALARSVPTPRDALIRETPFRVVQRTDGVWLEFANGAVNLDQMMAERGPIVRAAYDAAVADLTRVQGAPEDSHGR